MFIILLLIPSVLTVLKLAGVASVSWLVITALFAIVPVFWLMVTLGAVVGLFAIQRKLNRL